MAKKQFHKSDKVLGVNSQSSQNSISNVLMGTSPTFCVANSKKGVPFYYEGRSINDLLPKVKGCQYAWLNIQVDSVEKDGPKVAQALGFSPQLVTNLLKKRLSGYEDNIFELGLLLPAVHVNVLDVMIYPLIILMNKERIVTIHGPQITRLVKFSRYAVTFFKKIPKSLKVIDKLSLVLFRILDENNERNFDGIRVIQEQGEIISKFLVEPTGSRDRLGTDLYKIKRALIHYLETLWAALDVAQYLRYGDADILTDDPAILQKYGILGRDLTRQISISEQMSTVLASGLEVLQSIYNNQLTVLNNRLSLLAVWLAILGTAFIVPNTIATVFGTPIGEHLDWHTMMLILILSTVLSIALAYWAVKKKKLLPKKNH